MSGATDLMDQSYIRDPGGRITTVTSNIPGETWSYTCDTLDRLTSADSDDNARDQSFTYDVGGNILTATNVGTYTYPAGTAPRPHAVIEIAGQPLTYDAVGNMLTGRGRTLTWDGANRPSSIAMGGNTVAFAYGPNNSRFVKSARLRAGYRMGRAAAFIRYSCTRCPS